MKKNENRLIPLRPINEIKKKKKSENLWSKIETASHDTDLADEMLREEDALKKKSRWSKLTGLPFSRTVDENTAVTMVDLKAENPKYMVAIDGYIPNSEARLHYPPIFFSHPPSKKVKKPKDPEQEFIKNLLSKHLATEKITDVKKRTFNRQAKLRKKTHYVGTESDVITLQNEVTDHFNFEMDLAISEKGSEKSGPKIGKKKKLPSIKNTLQSLRSRVSFPKAHTQETLESKDTIKTEFVVEPTNEIDIDLLDKLDKIIEDNARLGLSNEKIHERILKDRSYRMDDIELRRCIELLEGVYSSKIMYNELTKALNRNLDSINMLEIHLESRQKRLEFLNTITDPQHIFKYLLHFYGNKSELIDSIHDVLTGSGEVNLKQFVLFCGEHYKLREFFKEFIAAKNYAQQILSTKISSEKDLMIDLENCLRGERISEYITFNIFMSSESDAIRFFECISECNIKEMISITEHIKEIKVVQKRIVATMTSEESSISETVIETPIVQPIVTKKPTLIDKPSVISLPALPEYNANSWKKMMSEYIAKMVSTIVPETETIPEIPHVFFQDENLLELMKELSFLHTEVLKLLKVYLNNDTNNAMKLLDGLLAEDNLAYQALIELIGEKEAMQIIKSLRLKQATVIEKIIESQGDKQYMNEASLLLKTMSHYLPESLTKNLNSWLNAGQVSAEEINLAVNILTQHPEGEDELSDTPTLDENSQFIFKGQDRRTRQSIRIFTFPEDEEAEITKGPLRRGSFMNRKLEFDYRDLVTRDSTTGAMLSMEKKYSLDVNSDKSENEIKTDDIFESWKKDIQISQISEMPIEEDNKVFVEDNMIDAKICEEICSHPWYKYEHTFKMEDVVFKLTEMLTETTNLNEAVEITETLVNVAEHTVDKGVNLLIVDKLISQVVTLINEDDKDQILWLNFLRKEQDDESYLENKTMEVSDHKQHRIDEIMKIKVDKVLKVEENKTLEEAIRISYEKNKKIKRIIEILKNFELAKAEELERVINNKISTCTLFVPEFNEHINVVRNLGMEFYHPHELVNINTDVIVRKNREEIRRTTIVSNKVDEIRTWLLNKKIQDDTFWEKASQCTKLKDTHSLETDTSNKISKDESKEDFEEDHGTLLPFSDKSIESVSAVNEFLEKDIAEILLVPPIYKKISSTSILKYKEALTVTPMTLKDAVYKGEYVDNNAIIQDESSLKYEMGYSSLFPAKGLYKRKPKDPYYDFHTLYGSTAYYLPYINPALQRKGHSREESFPQYTTDKPQDNRVFENVNKMIRGFGRSNTQVTPIFTNTCFVRRPTGVPLADWIKLGAPKMGSNMVIADQSYRHDNSKCRYHHLTKLRIHNYGISAAKHIERREMIEFIGKANAAIKHEDLKSKLETTGNTVSKTISSSGSLVKSF